WCPSPTTRSSTPGTPWAWRPRAARMSRSASCSCPSGGGCRPCAAPAAAGIPAPRPTAGRGVVSPPGGPPPPPRAPRRRGGRLAPAALGAAEGAHELFLKAMAQRAGTYTGARVADFQAVQIKVARARCLIDSARDLLRQSAIAFQAAAERHEVPDLETKLRFRAHSAFAVNQ